MSTLYVVFKVADTEFAMPASEVVQMESFTGATAVPGAPPYVAGLVQVRGRVVPVVDVRARFGLPPGILGLDSRIIIGQRNERPVAMWVDSAREVLKLEASQIEAPPRVLADETQGFVKAVARIDKRLVLLIEFGRVIGDEVESHGHAEERVT